MIYAILMLKDSAVVMDGIGTYYCDSFGFRRLDSQFTIFDL